MSSLAAYADKKSKSKDLAIFSICAILKDIVPGYEPPYSWSYRSDQMLIAIRSDYWQRKKSSRRWPKKSNTCIYMRKSYTIIILISSRYWQILVRWRPLTKRLSILLVPTGDSKHTLTIVSILLKAHPHFNFRKELVQLLLPYLSGANDLHLAACTTITDLFVTDELGSITGEILTPLLRKPITIPLLNALRAVKTYRLLVKEAKHKRKKFDKSKRTVDAEVDVEQRHKNVSSFAILLWYI